LNFQRRHIIIHYVHTREGTNKILARSRRFVNRLCTPYHDGLLLRWRTDFRNELRGLGGDDSGGGWNDKGDDNVDTGKREIIDFIIYYNTLMYLSIFMHLLFNFYVFYVLILIINNIC